MQDQLYQRLIELLGVPRPASASIFIHLIEDLKEKPSIDCEHERIWFYDLRESGIKLTFDNMDGAFIQANLCIATPEVECGGIRPYRGSLPYGIALSDSKETVELKFPGSTMSVKDYRTDIDLRPLVVTISFDVSGEKMTLVSIDYIR